MGNRRLKERKKERGIERLRVLDLNWTADDEEDLRLD